MTQQTPAGSSVPVSSRHRTAWPKASWVFADGGRLLMFGLGSGLLRPGSGTWGTLMGWMLWEAAASSVSDRDIALFLAFAFVYGCWAAGRVGRQLGVEDHVGIVWDEMVAFWLVLWLVPDTLAAQAVAVVLFRFFDVTKPPPIRQVDARLKSGTGVMVDDILAAGYTLLVMAVLIRLGAPL